ncbi:MAG: vitamin K epoxide reductase family protein [Chloroflexota bacterium]
METVDKSAVGSVPNNGMRFRLSLRMISLLLVAIGIGVSGYLSYVKATSVPMACLADSGFNCAAVQNSDYSELMGVPIAYLGLATYIVIGGLILLQDRIPFLRQNGMILTFGIVLFAFLYSVYLVYVQGVILEAWCQWCLMHEVNITVLFVVTSMRLRNYLNGSATA